MGVGVGRLGGGQEICLVDRRYMGAGWLTDWSDKTTSWGIKRELAFCDSNMTIKKARLRSILVY